jgi:hypothetical protein
MGYSLLGRFVWIGLKWALRTRYTDRQRKAAAALVVAGGIGVILVATRKPGA